VIIKQDPTFKYACGQQQQVRQAAAKIKESSGSSTSNKNYKQPTISHQH
jgi:hypothetical protein